MRGFYLLEILLAFIFQAHAKAIATDGFGGAKLPMDNLADKMVDKILDGLFSRAFKATCLHHTSLRRPLTQAHHLGSPNMASSSFPPILQRMARWRCEQTSTVRALGVHEAQQVISGLTEGIGLPCTLQNCGNVIERSTLDAVLREETTPLITKERVFVFLAIALYGSFTPGVLGGIFDYFLLRPVLALVRRTYTLDDYVLGRKLGEGGFGAVFEAEGVEDGKKYVLKRASDFGEAEIWMNQRLQRGAPGATADFVTAFEGSVSEELQRKEGNPLWMVWRFEGKQTLADLMLDKTFPYNVEPYLFKDGVVPGNLPSGPKLKAVIIGKIFDQILDALRRLHDTGIVHRDIKPANILFDDKSGKFRLIDLGAAADLRYGVNYSPKDFVFDPRYKAPEEYIMSRQTPEAPPLLLALTLSPVLWQLNLPDRFDMYSMGVTLLQMCIPQLRKDDDLVKFREDIKRNGNDMNGWRASIPNWRMSKPQWREGFEILDADQGAGWNLVRQLMATEGSRRPSAETAQKSAFVRGGRSVFTQFQEFLEDDPSLINEDALTRAGLDDFGRELLGGSIKLDTMLSETYLDDMKEEAKSETQRSKEDDDIAVARDEKPAVVFGRKTILGNVGNPLLQKDAISAPAIPKQFSDLSLPKFSRAPESVPTREPVKVAAAPSRRFPNLGIDLSDIKLPFRGTVSELKK